MLDEEDERVLTLYVDQMARCSLPLSQESVCVLAYDMLRSKGHRWVRPAGAGRLATSLGRGFARGFRKRNGAQVRKAPLVHEQRLSAELTGRV